MLKDEYVKFKNYERKVKSPFMIYADFKIIFSARRRWKAKSKKSIRNKYQKYVGCSYGDKVVCDED